MDPPYSGRKKPVVIDEGVVNVVWVKSVNRNSPLSVMQFKLKDEVKTIASPETVTACQHIPQTDIPKPEQTTQQPESLTSGAETQHEASEPQAQPTQKNEAVRTDEESQIEVSKPEQQDQNNEAQYSKAIIRLPE